MGDANASIPTPQPVHFSWCADATGFKAASATEPRGICSVTAGSASTGMYRGLRFWANAVKEAGTLDQNAVINALDHAKIAEGPGGPAEMVPGQHHARMHMYIAQANNGSFKSSETGCD
jgi:ABC-type branched-subunit amino acid transport system substrate-binding protein